MRPRTLLMQYSFAQKFRIRNSHLYSWSNETHVFKFQSSDIDSFYFNLAGLNVVSYRGNQQCLNWQIIISLATVAFLRPKNKSLNDILG